MEFCSTNCITNADLNPNDAISVELRDVAYCAYCDELLTPDFLALGVR